MLDQMLDGENPAVDLVADLHQITAVDEDDGAVLQHDGDAGRAGEAGQPGKPFIARRHVFILEAIGTRHDQAAEAAARQFGAQCRDPRRAFGALATILERLEVGLEHGGNLLLAAAAGNAGRLRPPPQYQRGPALNVEPPLKRERPVGGKRGVRLRRQQAGQHDAAARRQPRPQRRGEALQRPQQDIGEDQAKRRPRAEPAAGHAVSLHNLDHSAGAIKPRVGARSLHRAGIDVGCQHRLPQGPRGRDGEHARTGAEVEDPARRRSSGALGTVHGTMPAAHFADAIEREQASAGGAMMAGAERQRRLDLDADGINRDAKAVMATVDDEAAGSDRRQASEAPAYPIGRRDALETQRLGRRRPGSSSRERAQRLAVNGAAKMDRHLPASAARIGKTDRDIRAVESLRDQVGDPARGSFIGREPGHG
jgi:hypothetical protein